MVDQKDIFLLHIIMFFQNFHLPPFYANEIISFSVLKLQLIISSVIASNCLMCTWLRITLLTTVLAREGRIFFNTTQVRGLLTSLRTSSSPRQNHCHWHQLCQRPKRALPFPPLPVEQNLPISSRDNPNMHAQRIF